MSSKDPPEQQTINSFSTIPVSPQDTKISAFKSIRDRGDDEKIRKRAAAAIAVEPMITEEVIQVLGMDANSVRPRVNELIRMGCIAREGKEKTSKGKDAYVNHITPTGIRYLQGEASPEMRPSVSKLKTSVVNSVRDYLRGNLDINALETALIEHDEARKQEDPEWENNYRGVKTAFQTNNREE